VADDIDVTVLLAVPSRESVHAELLGFLQRPEFPVTDWFVGGVVRTMLEIETEVLEDLVSHTIPSQVTEGGYLDTAEGDWLTDLARGWYEIDRSPSAVASQAVTLANASTTTYTITAGRLFLKATDGAEYVAASGGTLSPSGTLAITVTATSPGQARGLISAIITPLPGVTISQIPTVSPIILVLGGISQFGADAEGDESVRTRAGARWPDLDTPPADDRLVKWAKAADVTVKRVKLDADPVNAGGVILTLAAASGTVSGGTVTAVQTYVDARLAITDYVTAQAATEVTVHPTGTVFVPATLLAAAQAAADAAWLAYLASAPIGSDVKVSRLEQAVMDAGATDVDSLALTGGTPNLSLGSTEVPVGAAGGLATALTWVST